jgi:hypothetical protein
MRAIIINAGTLEKIKEVVAPEAAAQYDRWYSSLTLDPSGSHQVLYFVTGCPIVDGKSMIMPFSQFEEMFTYTHDGPEDDWFDIELCADVTT